MLSVALLLLLAAAPPPATLRTVPVAALTGRLALPTPAERRKDGGVWVTVTSSAAHPDLVGQRLWLTLRDDRFTQARRKRVTVDVTFGEEARAALKAGDLVPARINGWRAVSPLESLAGARSLDDVAVALRDATIDVATRSVAITREPLQIAGTEVMLATVVGQSAAGLQVRGYDVVTHTFSGPVELVRPTPLRAKTKGKAPLTSTEALGESPLNARGWFFHGSRDSSGTFIVEALVPRALRCPQPETALGGNEAVLRYVQREAWRDVAQARGTVHAALLSTTAAGGALDDVTKQAVAARFAPGDRALVVHLFGGVDGPRGEGKALPMTETGHFAYGIATAVDDALSGERCFDIEYKQVYANNHEGIVAGAHSFAAYQGSLVRGWMYLRPTSDLLVRLPVVTEPTLLPGRALDPLETLGEELDLMTARYRTGDGTGAAIVRPSSSCVQDANQALFIALDRFAKEVEADPAVAGLRKDKPRSEEVLRLARLREILERLEQKLLPLGGLRPDWREATTLKAVVREGAPSLATQGMRAALTLPTIFPRDAHDVLAELAVTFGADFWLLRGTQVGGRIDGIEPTAPQSVVRR
jgi:predicted Abi (CAAX) family protease